MLLLYTADQLKLALLFITDFQPFFFFYKPLICLSPSLENNVFIQKKNQTLASLKMYMYISCIHI